jgi:hypothetical protein
MGVVSLTQQLKTGDSAVDRSSGCRSRAKWAANANSVTKSVWLCVAPNVIFLSPRRVGGLSAPDRNTRTFARTRLITE